jgi:hypothetical protein
MHSAAAQCPPRIRIRGAAAARVASLAVSLVLLGAVASSARAGTFTVIADCTIPGGVNHAFIPSSTDPTSLLTSTECPTAGGRDGGIHVGETLHSPNPFIFGGASAGYSISAPPGTAITGITYRRYAGQDGDRDTIPALRDGNGNVVASEWCQYPKGPFVESCEVGSPFPSAPPIAISALSTTRLRFGLLCVPDPPAIGCNTSASTEQAWFSVFSAAVTITENSVPSLGALSGDLEAGRWLRGTRSLALTSSSDPSGIASVGVSIDGATAAGPTIGGAPPCDFSFPRPCSDVGNAAWSIDTAGLADGQHTAVVSATNAAGVSAFAPPVSFRADNTPPAGPIGLTSSVGTAWQTSDTARLKWTLPDQGAGSPIAAAFVAQCNQAGLNCGPATLSPSPTTATVRAPGPGSHTARVWFVDDAGNVDPSTANAVPFRYADAAPPAPTAMSSSALTWQSSRAVDVRWTPPTRGTDEPLLAFGEVEICDSDGSACGQPQKVGVAGGRVELPREGAFLLRGWDVDEAGLGDRAHAATAIALYSSTPPTTSITQAPPARSTSRAFAVAFRSTAGGPAPLAQTTWTVCSSDRCPLRGQTTSDRIIGTVPGPGTWTVTLTPADVAGVDGAGAATAFVVLPRIGPRIRLKPVLSHGRLRVRIAADKRLSGAVALEIRYRSHGRSRTLRAGAHIRRGMGRTTARLPATATAATIVARYAGSNDFRPSRVIARSHAAAPDPPN